MTPRVASATFGAVPHDSAQDLLKAAGMSGYEAKAYLALLGASCPLNGYEVAKSSGVPRSTVYETLGKLVARGAAIEVPSSGNGTAYVALPAEALIGRLRRETTSTIAGLERVLPEIGAGPQARVVQHLEGRDRLLERAVDVIDSAERALWLSIWPEEAAALVAAVDDAIGRGVDVSVISYGEPGPLGGHVYHHDYSPPEVVLERLGCRISIVVADHDQVMIAGNTDDESWGMWSDDRAVTLVAAEHVRHDIALQIIGDRLRAAGLADVWSNDPQLERLRDAAALDVRSQLSARRPPPKKAEKAEKATKAKRARKAG